MKHFLATLFLLLVTSCAHQQIVSQASRDPNVPRPVSYTVTLLNDAQLHVAVEMMGDVDGTTHIILPDRKVSNFRLAMQYGRLVPVEGTDEEVGIVASYGVKVKFHYIIDLPGRGEPWSGTYWDGTTLYLTGKDVWAVPYGGRLNDVSFEWRGFTGRSGAHSVAGSASRQREQLDHNQLRETMHIIGDAAARRDMDVAGTALTVWGLGDVPNLDELSTTAAILLSEARSYWHDRRLGRYLLIVTGSGIGITSGRAFHQGSLVVASDHMAGTIAHEIVHEWIPWPSIRQERWLTEGFTEHVAQLILMRSGVADTRTYAEEFNGKSWGHRGGTHPAEREARFPYEVGFLLAHHWRTEQSDPKRVDALLRGLVDRDASSGELETAIVEYLGPRAWQDVLRYVHDQKPLPDPAASDCFDVVILKQEGSNGTVRYPTLQPLSATCALFDFD